jgi:fused signal recognition particle receptor
MAEGFLASLKKGLKKTTQAMGLSALLGSGKIDEDFLESLEERLLAADLGPNYVMDLIEDIEEQWEEGKISTRTEVAARIRKDLLQALELEPKTAGASQKSPSVWFFLGVNGVGKTTSLGKIGKRLSQNGFSTMFAAGDTFRAAASEQLELWSERSGAQLVRHRAGGDPSAVVFDAYEAAKNREVEFLLIDTAGRLHNKKNLMAECQKMFRTLERLGGEPEEIFLVVDATTGQNAVQQAKLFNEVAPLTGLILTKMDGSAKGGVAFRLVKECGVPIKYIGLGEGADDLMDFEGEAFVEAIIPKELTKA